MSRGQSLGKTDSHRRTLKRCKAKENINDVDKVDGGKVHDFIIIDSPEPSELTSPSSRSFGTDKTPLYREIICIDDDETSNCESVQNNFQVSENQDHVSTSTNSNSQDASGHSHKSAEVDGEESQGSSECQGTASRKDQSRNWHNCKCVSPRTLYVTDDSDSDVVEDRVGNIREQWEKASSRKRRFHNVQKSQSSSDDQASGSRCNFDSQHHIGRDRMADRASETPAPSSSSNKDDGEDNCCSTSCAKDDTSHKLNRENQYAGVEEKINQETCNKPSSYIAQDRKSMSSSQLQVKLNPLSLVSNDVVSPNGQTYIIGEREMLKKTDAYKHADKEEWEFRQREMQIQAQEAQRLGQKKKAEAARLLDMERRQKRRVEEMREAKKKEEETSNLKEQYRAEVRKELDKLESGCRDMASLLRGLGILVGGSPNPLPNEVQAAYKQALFRFHPDRVLKYDIRLQIEAEEKFKLISRAKDGYILT